MSFPMDNFTRMEWDGDELTCFNVKNEPFGAKDFIMGSMINEWFETLEAMLKFGRVGPFKANMENE